MLGEEGVLSRDWPSLMNLNMNDNIRCVAVWIEDRYFQLSTVPC